MGCEAKVNGYSPRLLDAEARPSEIVTAVWSRSQLGGFTDHESAVLQRWLEPPALHLFCGGSTLGEVRVDLDPLSAATDNSDVLEFLSAVSGAQFQTVIADPPYSQKYQRKYGVPGRDFGGNEANLGRLLREMYRVCRPGGILAFKHWFDPAWVGSHLLHEVVTKYGGHRRITLLTVCRKNSWARRELVEHGDG